MPDAPSPTVSWPPATLDGMLPLLPNESNTEKYLDQPGPVLTQTRKIKSKLYTGGTKIKNVLHANPLNFSTKSFLTLRKSKNLTKDFLSHTPTFIKGHIRARHIVKKFSFLYLNLDKLLKQCPKSNEAIYKAPEVIDALTNTAKKIWETVTELEAEFFSPDGTHKSDLCTFIAHDLSTIMVHLYANEFIRKLVEEVAQEGREDGHPIRLPGDYAMLQHEDLTVTFISNRPETGSLTLLDMVHTKQEVIRCRDTLSTFLALKTSSELDFTVPAQNIRNHAITLKTLPIHFLKSRFM